MSPIAPASSGRPLFRPALIGAASIAACTLLAAACGGGSTSPSTTDPVVTLTSTGASPVEVRIPVGGRVTFLNSDARTHAMSSDPITTHTDCPAINDVGVLNPGQSRSTSPLTVARTCGFHDHTNEEDPKWKGRIVVQ